MAEVARQEELQAEVVFVDLTATSDPSSVDAEASAAVGLSEAVSRPALRELLDRKPRIVILDNCEHLVDASARLVSEMLAGTSISRFVATSRLPLRTPGEQILRLDPLGVESASEHSNAAQLFCERAGLDQGDLSNRDCDLIDEIVARLDGLPLAVELAAARFDALDLADLVAGLDRRFELLTGGDRSGHLRHRSLEATIAWSANLLDAACREVPSRCSVFAGPFSLADAVAICSDGSIGDGTVRRAVADLVDANLIEREHQSPPYRLLETIRCFGWDRPGHVGELTETRSRHARYFTDRAISLAAESHGPGEADVTKELQRQTDEYRAAILCLGAEQDWATLADLIRGLTTTSLSTRRA